MIVHVEPCGGQMLLHLPTRAIGLVSVGEIFDQTEFLNFLWNNFSYRLISKFLKYAKKIQKIIWRIYGSHTFISKKLIMICLEVYIQPYNNFVDFSLLGRRCQYCRLVQSLHHQSEPIVG